MEEQASSLEEQPPGMEGRPPGMEGRGDAPGRAAAGYGRTTQGMGGRGAGACGRGAGACGKMKPVKRRLADAANGGSKTPCRRAPTDTRIDQSAEDAAPDGPDSDATLDAVADVTPDEAPSPSPCGDGYRDPLTEECDDGLGNIPESRACTDACVVVDRLVKEDEAYLRGLWSIHHVASGPSGHAIMLGEMPQYNATRSPIVFFDSAGRRLSTLDDYYITLALAPLPDGSFVGADIAPTIGGLGLYKISAAGDSQLVSWFDYNAEFPAAVWSGSEMFVAWHDWVSGSVCTQRFDAELSALADATCSDGGVWDLSISADGSLGAVGWREDGDTGRIFVKGPGWIWESAELAQETHWRKPPALACRDGGDSHTHRARGTVLIIGPARLEHGPNPAPSPA